LGIPTIHNLGVKARLFRDHETDGAIANNPDSIVAKLATRLVQRVDRQGGAPDAIPIEAGLSPRPAGRRGEKSDAGGELHRTGRSAVLDWS